MIHKDYEHVRVVRFAVLVVSVAVSIIVGIQVGASVLGTSAPFWGGAGNSLSSLFVPVGLAIIVLKGRAIDDLAVALTRNCRG